MGRLSGKTVGVFVAEGFEDLEFWVPLMRIREEGARALVIGLSSETVTAKHCLTATPDVTADQVDAATLDGLVVPGGWAPDKLRRSEDVLRITRAVYEAGKPVGVICHGGWVAASAGIVRGMRVTGSRGIRDDMVNAGSTWVDEPAFRSGNVVWGRVVEDIPDFLRELIAALVDHAQAAQR
ncbi:MAG TPA: type 1 glutamine amidotransferase domain-containing protein [Ktedonobacterales bacterium]